MNVRMEGKVASPGVEDADEPDLWAQMSLVPGKLFQSCGAAVIEQAKEKASVSKKEAVAEGIVVQFGNSAVLTNRGIATKKSRFAPDDKDCDFVGCRSNRSRLAV